MAAADSAMGFGFSGEVSLGSVMNQHAISFQTGPISSSSETIGMGSYYGANNGAPGNLVFPGNSGFVSNNNASASQAGNSSTSVHPDPVTGLMHDTGLAVEWSTEEQRTVEHGLIKYADEPSLMKYIKIAATLRDKTVRDVVLRCRWMTRKRRKQDECRMGKKGNYRKDKMVESSPKANLSSASTSNVAAYSLTSRHMDQNERMRCEALSRLGRQLLEQNIQVFSQISSNMSSFKLQDNIDLFCRTRENINNLHAIMKETPGRISQMRELPVSINLHLADSILPRTTQALTFNAPSGILPKQDLRGDVGLSGVNV